MKGELSSPFAYQGSAIAEPFVLLPSNTYNSNLDSNYMQPL